MSIEKEIDTLARTLYGEARGEGEVGMTAVANVVMNRVQRAMDNEIEWWGDNVVDVCLKPWQFSCWLKNDPNSAKLKAVTVSDPIFVKALAIAKDAVSGELDDITNGATSYYAKGSKEPDWAKNKKPCATIRHHIFFQD